MDKTAALVSRYMAATRSQDFGSSRMRMGEDYENREEEFPMEEDEDDEDEAYNLEEDLDDEDIGEGSHVGAQGRKFKSKSWREFVPIHVDGEVTNGECKHCGAVISAKRGQGTSGLRNHLKRCKERAMVTGALNQMNATLMTPDGVSRLWKWEPDVARKMLVRMVVLHELPLSIVEYDGFQKFVASLNPSFHMIRRKALKNDILKAFDEHKKSLKELFGASKSRISLTMDLWTSNQTIGYMVITSHFINDHWKLEKRIIKFNTLETPHTGLSMFNMVLKCIRELNFEDKVFALTLDNASNNGRMTHMLRENLFLLLQLHQSRPLQLNLAHHHCMTFLVRKASLFDQDVHQFLEQNVTLDFFEKVLIHLCQSFCACTPDLTATWDMSVALALCFFREY